MAQQIYALVAFFAVFGGSVVCQPFLHKLPASSIQRSLTSLAPTESLVNNTTTSLNETNFDRKQYVLRADTPIGFLDSRTAFSRLKPSEKLYIHYFSRASWIGGLIDFFQSSAESPFIYLLFQKLFRVQSLPELLDYACKKCDFNSTEWDAFLLYVSGFYWNLGNYQTLGFKKIVPDLPQAKLACLVETVATSESSLNGNSSEAIITLWNITSGLVFNLESRYHRQGLEPNGVTTYFSSNCNEEDARTVQAFMVEKKIEAWNTRVIKRISRSNRTEYEIRMASVSTSNGTVDGFDLGKAEIFNGKEFWLSRGDFAPILRRVVSNLMVAKKYASNENQKKMIAEYLNSFTTGSLQSHKNASRFWVKDKSPIVEAYIGFIETYQDPDGQRGSFEGFVAVVDKEKTIRLTRLVANAEFFLPLLPWPHDFEKDVFLKPDFTDLTVVSYANGGVPIGINIPNYDEIRQNEGFKNVNLGNVRSATIAYRAPQFLSKEDELLINPERASVLDVNVGLHELLGHGSGKLFQEFANGSFNFNASRIGNVAPFGEVKTWYKPGETFNSKFGRMGGSFEECRAEAVATYLSLYPQVLNIWGISEKKSEEFAYLTWMNMASSGLQALADYSADTDTWGQAHAQGRFALLRVMIDAGVAKVDIVNGTDKNDDLLITMNRTRIPTEGKKALGIFLLGIQFYRSTGNAEEAKIFYDRYTSLKGPNSALLLSWHKISLARKLPKAMLVQPNTLFSNGTASGSLVEEVIQRFYNGTTEGMIQSFQERFNDPGLENELFALASRDFKLFLI